MSNDCPRAGRWIGGCKFEPRHDRVPTATGEDAFWIIESKLQYLKKRVYVRDICVRCGKTIERKEPPCSAD